jgi:tRNA-specific 2-thiouridylase
LHHVKNQLVVRFYEDAKGVAPGQSAVFYDGDDVIAGGIIQRYKSTPLQ